MTTNREISEAFKQARQFVDTRSTSYICIALKRCDIRGITHEDVVVNARKIIQARMGNFYTLEDWLVVNVSDFDWDNAVKIQATRHAWLDSLIEEFDVDGDCTSD